jgi:2-octaprenyl-6-methoxyphenol hydroxylase
VSGLAGRYDVAIAGGGMIGASLALALAATELRVLLVEAVPADGATADGAAQPSFDDRTTALGNGARAIFESLGVWPALRAAAGAIRAIHVSDAGHFGFARLEAAQFGQEAFGYTVGNRHIGAVLWSALRLQSPVTLASPARVLGVELAAEEVRLRIAVDGAAPCTVSAALVVAADGAHSLVKQVAGIESSTTDYGQVALIAHIKTDRAAHGIAFERFTAAGPIALLPLFGDHYAAVWTLAPPAAAAMQQCDPAQFCERLQQCFGWRAGRICEVGARTAYPLRLVRALQPTGMRTALVGNAAQALHPVAAQGFNLGLRDVAALAELVARAPDPGAPALLAQFAAGRQADRRGMIGFTDRLVKLFGDQRPGAIVARNLGLLLFDVLPPAKRAMARLSFGFGRALPRLVRGLPL